ncbi:hypothetical protein PM10SUCC1_29840 [Propionigenium maris DSM 9537]|uniref:Uncharacterized protein n=1 Tax=Propionigenium maris DSM 9537 TaxID=1123000 RepID=A0A9W6LPW5_9FUSO|nr:hypothetical protein [Propionigenium maris]GLI57470.1 hypothetical protein PM10SUCC1_29840 [Propionigenium maris DSM 9537]
MEIKLNFNGIKEKVKNLKKREILIGGVVIFALMILYLKFSKREDNFHILMELQPNRSFVIEDVMEDERAKVYDAIKQEEERNKGVGRDIFFSYTDGDGIAPTLTGVMIGRKRTATFSNGMILEVGDEFYGHKIKRVLQGRVVIEDGMGDEKTLEIRRN